MKSRITSFAEFYHEETKYSPAKIAKNSHSLDFDSQPIPFKEYFDHEQIDLSSYIPLSTNPFSDSPLKRHSEWTAEELPLAELSRILYFANGVTAIVPYPPNPLLMRAAPSAGGLYPNEIYIVTKNYPAGIGSGVFNFQVKTQSLVRLNAKDDAFVSLKEACFNNSAFEHSNLVVVITGVFERSAWRYQDRAYRRILLDAGHILGNLTLASYSFNRKAFVVGGFNDEGINELLQLDEEEQTLLVVPLVNLDKVNFVNQVESPSTLPSEINCDFQIPEGKRINALHEYSKIHLPPSPERSSLLITSLKEYLEQPQDSNFECFLSGEVLECSPIEWERCALMNTILRRRSARAFDSETAITKKQLAQILQFAYNPECYKCEGFDDKPTFFSNELLKSYLIVNNVEGLDPGCYSYFPEQKSLKQIRFKKLKSESQNLCLGQEMGRDAAAILFHTADLTKAVKIFGERVYRYLHMDAGNISERINLAAMKLGLGASPIGGFFDDLATEVLGICPYDIIVHVTTIGTPLQEDAEE
jgi:SagB-type dehydrogenase family enzyme